MTKKISQLPADSAPSLTDTFPTYDPETGLTKQVSLSDLISLMFTNVPAGANSPITRWDESFRDYMLPNTGVWTADSAGVNRNASMTAATVYINGRRISVGLVTARTFTASKDTYVDILDNTDGTGTLVYTEVANNAASPALASNSIRIAIIVTGATTIAAAASINQGQEDRVLPIASSIPYTVTDSLGNQICNKVPIGGIIGYRQTVGTSFTTTSLTDVQITGLSMPIIATAGRKVLLTMQASAVYNNTSGSQARETLWDGVVASGTQLQFGTNLSGSSAIGANPAMVQVPKTLSAGLHTINGGLRAVTSGTAQFEDTGGGNGVKYIMAREV